jgi:hypothetical protein
LKEVVWDNIDNGDYIDFEDFIDNNSQFLAFIKNKNQIFPDHGPEEVF